MLKFMYIIYNILTKIFQTRFLTVLLTLIDFSLLGLFNKRKEKRNISLILRLLSFRCNLYLHIECKVCVEQIK